MNSVVKTKARPKSNEDEWDSLRLGRDEAFVKRADTASETALDEALCLQMISIRLQKQLIDDLKFISTAHGIGYQPLIRDILMRFVTHEKKQIIREVIERRQLEAREKETAAAKRDVKPTRHRKVA